MHTAAGEVLKKSMENPQQSVKEGGRKSSFDTPGETSRGSDHDLGKGETGNPGSGFDGPWDQNETGQKVDEISAINKKLEGKEHPETGVRYERKESERPDGTRPEIVMPEFDPAYETKLDKNENGTYTGSRQKHEAMCNEKLRNDVIRDPSLSEKFTKEQKEQIMDRETPDGYTWHHEAEPGRIQLVDTKKHAETRHTGGYSIWGKSESLEA